jgi:transcriptional regulator with XRE-family HTH domain
MTDRILSLIKQKNLSPSQFADEIGIQRSTLSHIVAGRNKPSLDVVQKIIARYPDTDINWLISGTASNAIPVLQGPVSASETIIDPGLPGHVKDNVQESVTNHELPEPVRDTEVTVPRKIKKPASAGSKKVEKIVVFYSDRTFSEYFPEEGLLKFHPGKEE